MARTLYHVTNHRNAASILAHGLRTTGEYADSGGWCAGYVWAFDSLAIAIEARDAGRWGLGGAVIIEFDAEGLDVVPDPHPGWGSMHPGWDAHAVAIAGSGVLVPPEDLSMSMV